MQPRIGYGRLWPTSCNFKINYYSNNCYLYNNFVENHKLTLIHHFSVGLKSCMGGAARFALQQVLPSLMK